MSTVASTATTPRIAVIGGGPAGLMAAEQIAAQGLAVDLFDAMPSVARKFLLAGIGGMNITHSEDYPAFVSRYGKAADWLKPMLDELDPTALRQWIHDLGIETFVGTSGRVFPTDMKAAPLLRAWLHRLRQQGVQFHPRHRWCGWQDTPGQRLWCFETPDGEVRHAFDAVVLALGGGSWARLGSDGRWQAPLQQAGIGITPLCPSNCGFELEWSPFLKERFAGTPLKHIALSLTDRDGQLWYRPGEFVISEYGIEGSLVYALSAPLRDLIQAGQQQPLLHLDWLPNLKIDALERKLREPRKGMSFANVLRKKLNLPAITGTLLKECCPQLDQNNPAAVAATLKAMPLTPQRPRPIDEAISSAGGIQPGALNDHLMLTALPGVFAAGEMLDWEAPTGGYLLTACFATGRRAGRGVVRWLHDASK